MSQLTLNLPDSIASELVRSGLETSRTPEAIAEDMIQRMISLQRFDRMRAEVHQAMGNADSSTEGDILDEIS